MSHDCVQRTDKRPRFVTKEQKVRPLLIAHTHTLTRADKRSAGKKKAILPNIRRPCRQRADKKSRHVTNELQESRRISGQVHHDWRRPEKTQEGFGSGRQGNE
ncbi:hypothetical protein RRG08_013211 [Elysia crispata]|uniref:Uncharacterized protein n=1 Tax=Elysia crispata TaxID=231223 RepID=A0AAE1B5T6_9GAST|nr:hypothetical protein RRG08_013211 [Elysia crispata]